MIFAALVFLATLQSQVETIARQTDATVGIAAIDLETGRSVRLHANEHFPMASVFKFPVAMVVLHRVDEGAFHLDDAITIQPAQFSRGHSPLRDSAKGKAVTTSVRRLIELMVVESDNTAVDYFIRRLGSDAITSRIRAMGGEGVRVDRPENDIAVFIEKQGIARYVSDPRDTATPGGMAALLTNFARGKDGLKPASHDLLLQFMTASHNPVRIGAALPAGATVAHKTGTMPGVFNDAGIITSADGKHHVVIVILTKKSSAQNEETSLRVASQIARAVYDAFAVK
jgi:beta-lactamase class A